MIKKSIEYILFSGMTAGIGFLTVIYMTRNMTVEQFGIVGLFMAVLYVLPQLISFSSIGLISINKVKLNSNDFILFSKSYFTFGIMIFIYIFIILLIVGKLFDEYLILFIFIPIISFIQYFGLFHNAELIQDGKSRRFGTYRLILSILSLSFTVIALSYFHLSWDGRVYAILFSEVVVLLITVKYSFNTLKVFQTDFNKDKFKEYFYFGLPLLFGLGAGWLLNQADRFIVLKFFTLKEVGIYTLAYSIGTIINIINQAVTNAIVPTIYNYLEKKEGHKIIKKLNIYYSITILILAIVIGGSSFWYVPLFFSDDYAQSPSIILFISLAFAFSGVYRTTSSVIAFYKQNRLQMNLLYLSATVNIIFSIALIPIYGILAPAIATVLAYIILAITSYIYGWKTLKREELC